MINRNLLAWTTAISALLCASFASAQRSRLDDLTRDYRISRSDAAAAIVLAGSLHMSERDIVYAARDCGRGVFDVAPAFVIANYADEGVERVWRQRDGRRWLDYALDLRIDIRSFNRLDVREDDFDRMMWANLLDGTYGCRPTLWDDMRGRGLSARDALVAIVLGEGDPYYCDHIYTEYRRCSYDWAPVFVWFVGFDIEFGHRHHVYRDDYRRDRDYRVDRRYDDRVRTTRDRNVRDATTVRDRRDRGLGSSDRNRGSGSRDASAGTRDRGNDRYSSGSSRDRGSSGSSVARDRDRGRR